MFRNPAVKKNKGQLENFKNEINAFLLKEGIYLNSKTLEFQQLPLHILDENFGLIVEKFKNTITMLN
eukprot:snap_masked-scaffold_90-processed-gene-0.0-mRNA-1 protein AED:1.00 eAED:1.00 QI:0/0/0/0/1/1/3/0/66